MGASMHHNNLKGHPPTAKNSATARRYVVMLLLAFTAAVIGVMLLHMFRERRVFSLLLKDKDSQIITLQILLQKERDHAKEVKHKTQDMKSKIDSLRSHKLALHAKLLEMHSIFSSIKEERKAMELLIQEKQGEIDLLRRQQQQQQPALARPVDDDEITSQALDNKNDYPPPVNNVFWSVNGDDPSNSNSNPKNAAVNSNTMNGQYSTQEQNDVVNRELGSESIKTTIESSTEPDHDLNQGSATSLDVREESNNQLAHGTEGGGDPEEIAATKLESATITVDAGAKASGTRHDSVARNRRSRHSKEKKWKMLLKSRRSQAASRDGAGAVDVDTAGKLDRQLRNDDQVNLSSSTPVLNDIELLKQDGNGGDQSKGADADEQRLIGKGEQTTTSEERTAGSDHYPHSEATVVLHDEENNNSIKSDKVGESVIVTEDIKEGGKDQEPKQEEGGKDQKPKQEEGGDDDPQQEEEEPEF